MRVQRLTCGAIALAITSATLAQPCLDAFVDDFGDGVLDSRYKVNTFNGTVTETGGKLSCTVGAVFAFGSAAVELGPPSSVMCADFSVSVDFQFTSVPTLLAGSSAHASLVLVDAGTDQIVGGIQGYLTGAGSACVPDTETYKAWGGTATSDDCNAVFSAPLFGVQSGRLRIDRFGDQYTLYGGDVVGGFYPIHSFTGTTGDLYLAVSHGHSLSGQTSTSATFDRLIYLDVPNDTCVAAPELPTNASITIDNFRATIDPGDILPDCVLGSYSQDFGSVWYSFIATHDSIEISTCDTTGLFRDTILGLYESPCLEQSGVVGGPLIDCNDNACGDRARIVARGLTIGQRYYIRLSGKASFDVGLIHLDLVSPAPPAPALLYVDQSAGGTGTGDSWSNAMPELWEALVDARQYPEVQEIHVAEGTYLPGPGAYLTQGYREQTFELVDGVPIYGSYPAGGGSMQDRDHSATPTVLTGDLQQNDTLNFDALEDNVYHVVTVPYDGDYTLDRVIVWGGSAEGAAVDGDDRGGGLYHFGKAIITINDCRFIYNFAQSHAAAMSIEGEGVTSQNTIAIAQLYVFDSEISQNRTDPGPVPQGGNAITLEYATAEFERCELSFNHILDHPVMGNIGGAVLVRKVASVPNSSNTSLCKFTDCELRFNAAEFGGAAAATEGASISSGRCEIRNNNAEYGGAYYADASGASANASFSTFSDNGSAFTLRGGAVCVSEGFFYESDFDGNCALSGGAVFVKDIELDPTFQTVVDFLNCTLRFNSASHGGAIAVAFDGAIPEIDDPIGNSLSIRESFVHDNVADIEGGAIYVNESAHSAAIADLTPRTSPPAMTLNRGYHRCSGKDGAERSPWLSSVPRTLRG